MTVRWLRLASVLAGLTVAATGCGSARGSHGSSTPSARVTVSPAAACKTISDSLRILVSAASQGRDNPGLKDMVGLIRAMRDTAPSAIRVDLQVIADFDQKVVDAVLSGTRPDTAETPQLTAAMKHEAAWTATHCGHV